MVVVGPQEGFGKTTYTGAMSELLRSFGKKVNLDLDNENKSYTLYVDIAECCG